jgi:Flp pilus assembly protein TadG
MKLFCATGPRAQQTGTAAVELAIALPVLLLLLVASAEVGRLLSQYDTLTKSVRNGARYLASNALGGTTGVVLITPQVQTQTQNLVVTGNINGSGTALLPNFVATNVTVTTVDSTHVSVTAAYTYQPLLGATLPTFGIGSPISFSFPLTATVVMRGL